VTALTSLARVLAVESGRAQPIRTVRHTHISERPLVFVPIALAGEANAPVAAMVGDNRLAPTLLVVPEPRDRAQRFAFMAELADVMLRHIAAYDVDEPRDAPQLLVPNPAGVAFTRLLGRSTRFRRTTGEYAVPVTVPVLGRWLSFYTERRDHISSSLLLPATDILTGHWATGQSAAEDLNLATLLAWIDPPDGMTGAEAALLVEDPVRCPPAGPVTDPSFDNEVLEPCVNAVRAARLTGRGTERAVSALTEALGSQLQPTWELMWRAIGLLRALPPGEHVASRWQKDVGSFAWHANHIREGGPPQARRDGAVAAARRLAALEREADEVAAERAFDDELVMAEYRMAGQAFAGRVTEAEPERLVPSGKRRVLRPLITVATSDAVRCEPGDTLVSPARPAQKALVVAVSRERVVMELEGGMGRSLTPAPGSVPEVGERACYAAFGTSFRRPPRFPERERTPWTHGGPPPEYVPSDEDAREDWS
jgi:hypothetical protein